MKLNIEERSHFACSKLFEDKGLSDYARSQLISLMKRLIK
ncbi:MAG: hypothetical protein BWY19_01175 [bacterium ADurb.Bin212]|nr:MAG: hypothetical protein BWY19_01175 [bacterium ADurb.Bin212]